jgi:putative inorganic carbon (HCO3(-)) transporter
MNFRLLEKPSYLILPIAIPAFILYQYSGQSLTILVGILAFTLAGISHLFKWDKYFATALLATLFFSVDLPILGGSNLAVPAEPLAAILAMSSIFALVLDQAWREKLTKLFPIRVLSLFFLVFLLSSFFSTMPKVSFKYITVWLTYALSALSIVRLLHYQEVKLQNLLKIFAISLTLLGLLSIYNLLPYNFNPGAAPLMARPFFKDHTVFSATIAMFSPLLILWPKHQSKAEKYLFKLVGFFLIFVVLISSSRAAWLSIIFSFSLYAIIRLKVKMAYILGATILVLATVYANEKKIRAAFLINPYQSSNAVSSIEDQALSVTNVSSDPSNMERLNRWKCAWRMFESKPIYGFGPGTYQFQYFPFQRDEDMTYISVTSPFLNKPGRGGSAHSEYLLLLSESGIFSFLLWLAFLAWLLSSTIKKVRRYGLTDESKMLVAVFLGLCTYIIHALFNNYLNVAVFGVAFWFLSLVFIYLNSIQSHGEA